MKMGNTDIFCTDRLDMLGSLGFKGLELGEETICSPMARLGWDGPVAEMGPCDRCRSLEPRPAVCAGFMPPTVPAM